MELQPTYRRLGRFKRYRLRKSIHRINACYILLIHFKRNQTKSHIFFCLSYIIATTPIINKNTAPLLLLSQSNMFFLAGAFNQDISEWEFSSSAIKFVSGLGLWESWSFCCFRLLSSAHCLCCCRP